MDHRFRVLFFLANRAWAFHWPGAAEAQAHAHRAAPRARKRTRKVGPSRVLGLEGVLLKPSRVRECHVAQNLIGGANRRVWSMFPHTDRVPFWNSDFLSHGLIALDPKAIILRDSSFDCDCAVYLWDAGGSKDGFCDASGVRKVWTQRWPRIR